MITACALRGWKVEHDLRNDTYIVLEMRSGKRTELFSDLETCKSWITENLEKRLAEALCDMAENI